jgi:uncharacterized protein (TIGR02996 family)
MRDLAELYAAVYAALDADEPRAVLADALLEQGDPRGEFIGLQLREARGDTTMRDRAQALVREHGKQWLGALRPITQRAKFNRGFLHELELAGSWRAKNWGALACDPLLVTVERVAAAEATTKLYANFMSHTVAPSLRSIEVENDDAWRVVEKTRLPRLRSVDARSWSGRPSYEERFVKRVVPWLARSPNITELACRRDMVEQLPAPVLARLTKLSIDANVAQLTEVWHRHREVPMLEATWSSITIQLIRTTTGVVARATSYQGGDLFSHPMANLAELPAEITQLELIDNIEHTKQLAGTLADRFTVTASRSPSGFITGS